MKLVAKIALAVCVAGAVGCGAGVANASGNDAWETPRPTGLHDCSSIETSLIVPVPLAHRSEAIARLKDVASVELSQPELGALLDRRPGTTLSGADLLRNAIERLRTQRQDELENRHGSWSLEDQQRLDDLAKLRAEPTTSELRPFLVRAVAGNEGTGGYFASLCGESLWILHGSLGHSAPPLIRAPVAILLRRKPTAVYVGWSMAE